MENIIYTHAVKWKILVSSQWTCKFCPVWLQFYALFQKCIWWHSSTRENVNSFYVSTKTAQFFLVGHVKR